MRFLECGFIFLARLVGKQEFLKTFVLLTWGGFESLSYTHTYFGITVVRSPAVHRNRKTSVVTIRPQRLALL